MNSQDIRDRIAQMEAEADKGAEADVARAAELREKELKLAELERDANRNFGTTFSSSAIKSASFSAVAGPVRQYVPAIVTCGAVICDVFQSTCSRSFWISSIFSPSGNAPIKMR